MAKVINFSFDTAEFTLLYPDAILKLPLSKLYKLFVMMFSETRRNNNAHAIEATFHALYDYFEETKARWAVASSAYQTGFVDTKYTYCADKKRVVANNKKLMNAVKSAKHQHERSKKLLDYFNKTADKYS